VFFATQSREKRSRSLLLGCSCVGAARLKGGPESQYGNDDADLKTTRGLRDAVTVVTAQQEKKGRGFPRPFHLQRARLHAPRCCGRKGVTDSLLLRFGLPGRFLFFGAGSAWDCRSSDLASAGAGLGRRVACRCLYLLRESGHGNDGHACQ
jgi:hypothetical protein